MKTHVALLGWAMGVVCLATNGEVDETTDFIEHELPLPLGKLGWSGILFEGGPELEYWGDDFDDIEAKVQADYPGVSIHVQSEDEGTSLDFEEADKTLEARQERKPICNDRYGRINAPQAISAVQNLAKVPGRLRVRGSSCVRVQCYGEAGIALCNDRPSEQSILATTVARYAREIATTCIWVDHCCLPYPRGCGICGSGWTTGQKFSPNRSWNTIVARCGAFNP